jgi:hypothetical protein
MHVFSINWTGKHFIKHNLAYTFNTSVVSYCKFRVFNLQLILCIRTFNLRD